jgi:hypothetical protein
MLVMLLGMFLLSFTSASLGTFKQNDCVDIKTILNISAVTISSLNYPNSSTALNIIEMDKNGLTFNYTFCNTLLVGTYNYDYNDTEGNVYVNSFDVTPSGESGSSNQIFFILFFVVAYGIGFFGFFGKNMLISFLGGIAMIFLGIYTSTNGIIIYKDAFTSALSNITLGIGFIFMLLPIVEYLQEQFE